MVSLLVAVAELPVPKTPSPDSTRRPLLAAPPAPSLHPPVVDKDHPGRSHRARSFYRLRLPARLPREIECSNCSCLHSSPRLPRGMCLLSRREKAGNILGADERFACVRRSLWPFVRFPLSLRGAVPIPSAIVARRFSLPEGPAIRYVMSRS